MASKYGNPSPDEIKNLTLLITDNKAPDQFFSEAEQSIKLPKYVKNYILDSLIRRLYQFICHAPENADMVEFIPESPKKDIVSYCVMSSILLDILPHFYDHKEHSECDRIILSYITDNQVSPLFDNDVSTFCKNLLDRTKTGLNKVFGFTKKDLSKIEECVKKAVNHENKKDFEYYFTLLDDFKYVNINSQTVNFIYKSITKDYVYLTQDSEKFFEEIKTIIPECSAFMIPWLKGFTEVGNGNLKEAAKLYKTAFNHINYAGDYIAQFLHQVLTLFLYLNNKKDAVMMWNYGAECGLFNFATDEFIDTFNAPEQFYVQFPLSMFKDKEGSYKSAVKNYTKKSDNPVKHAVNTGDLEGLKALEKGTDFNKAEVDDVTPLYYAIQRKSALLNGEDSFILKIVDTQTKLMLRNLNISSLSPQNQEGLMMNVYSQMNNTYKKTGLGKAMFEAEFGSFDKKADNVKALDDIIRYLSDKTDNVDGFILKLNGKMGATPLYIAAETDDEQTCKLLLEKGADPDIVLGSAPFGMKYKDGKNIETELPNTFIYRLINFKAFNTLKMYLSDYTVRAKSSMTQKSDKSNITPLVYLILNMLYTARSKAEYDSNAVTVNELLPLFIEAGSVLTEQTAFGTAKELLGM